MVWPFAKKMIGRSRVFEGGGKIYWENKCTWVWKGRRSVKSSVLVESSSMKNLHSIAVTSSFVKLLWVSMRFILSLRHLLCRFYEILSSMTSPWPYHQNCCVMFLRHSFSLIFVNIHLPYKHQMRIIAENISSPSQLKKSWSTMTITL